MYTYHPLLISITGLILATTTKAIPAPDDTITIGTKIPMGPGPETTWGTAFYSSQDCSGDQIQANKGSGDSLGCLVIDGEIGSVSVSASVGIYNFSFYDNVGCTKDELSPATYEVAEPDCIDLGVFHPKSYDVVFAKSVLKEVKPRWEELNSRSPTWHADGYSGLRCSGDIVDTFSGDGDICKEIPPHDDAIKSVQVYADAGNWTFGFSPGGDKTCSADSGLTIVEVDVTTPLSAEGKCVTPGEIPSSFYVHRVNSVAAGEGDLSGGIPGTGIPRNKKF